MLNLNAGAWPSNLSEMAFLCCCSPALRHAFQIGRWTDAAYLRNHCSDDDLGRKSGHRTGGRTGIRGLRNCIVQLKIQRSTLCCVRGLVKFVPAIPGDGNKREPDMVSAHFNID